MSLPPEFHFYLSSALGALVTQAASSKRTRRFAFQALTAARKALRQVRQLRREFEEHQALESAPLPARLSRGKEGST